MQLEDKYKTGFNQNKAKVIADSVNPAGVRLTTFVTSFPRIVLSELNTHRKFSRNSASSRAIPFKKMVEKAADGFIPMAFQKEHSGMQGTKYLEGEALIDAVKIWVQGRSAAIEMASKLNSIGATKQVCNRMLEPYVYHTCIITSTDFENFFALRAHEATEIHLQDLAYKMLDEYNSSKPKELDYEDWHVPFGDQMPDVDKETQIKIAVARCARVSYENFSGDSSIESDVNLYDRLSIMGHFSPFEHVAQASATELWESNFHPSWKQLRCAFKNQNRRDGRVLKK